VAAPALPHAREDGVDAVDDADEVDLDVGVDLLGAELLGRCLAADAGAGDEQIVPIAVNLDGLTFTATGTYRVVIAIDGKDNETLPFRINVMLPSQAGPIIR